MSTNLIDYTLLVDSAMHLIVKKSLEIFANAKDRGEHHFFISFITKFPEVVISEKLVNKYPYEMTIVLQHQFDDLKIEDDRFSVVLSFDQQLEKIVIPFAALTAFADPSVKFGLQFRHIDEFNPKTSEQKPLTKINLENKEAFPKSKPSKTLEENKDNIISLDFQNKKRL